MTSGPAGAPRGGGTARRVPVAVANWKMAMTVGDSLAFARTFRAQTGDLAKKIDIIICPPFTALHPLAQALAGSGIHLAGQNVSPGTEPARTGEVSATQLRDAGCGWVLLGHWEVRRHLGVTDAVVRQQLQRAFEAGLRPIVGIGEARDQRDRFEAALDAQLAALLAGFGPDQVRQAVLMAEPEWTIGRDSPAPVHQIAARVTAIRRWLEAHAPGAAGWVRVFYGGSVTPQVAQRLLEVPGIDGLGVGRKGRDPGALTDVVRTIAQTL
jgi:triosephosphate isomerase